MTIQIGIVDMCWDHHKLILVQFTIECGILYVETDNDPRLDWLAIQDTHSGGSEKRRYFWNRNKYSFYHKKGDDSSVIYLR